MNIRLLHAGDEVIHTEAIRLLNDGAEITQERSAALLAEPTYVFIVAVTDAGEVMGRIYGHVLHRYRSTDLLLYEVDVAEAHRRKGVGQSMLAFVNELMAERGYAESWVLTEDDNLAAQKLYDSVGGKLEAFPTRMYVFKR